MNNLRVFQNGCANEAKTVDMIQSTFQTSVAPFHQSALKRVIYSYACFRLQLFYLFYISYKCLHGPWRYLSHSS